MNPTIKTENTQQKSQIHQELWQKKKISLSTQNPNPKTKPNKSKPLFNQKPKTSSQIHKHCSLHHQNPFTNGSQAQHLHQQRENLCSNHSKPTKPLLKPKQTHLADPNQNTQTSAADPPPIQTKIKNLHRRPTTDPNQNPHFSRRPKLKSQTSITDPQPIQNKTHTSAADPQITKTKIHKQLPSPTHKYPKPKSKNNLHRFHTKTHEPLLTHSTPPPKRPQEPTLFHTETRERCLPTPQRRLKNHEIEERDKRVKE